MFWKARPAYTRLAGRHPLDAVMGGLSSGAYALDLSEFIEVKVNNPVRRTGLMPTTAEELCTSAVEFTLRAVIGYMHNFGASPDRSARNHSPRKRIVAIMAHVEDPMPCRRCGRLQFRLAVFRNTGFERGLDPDGEPLLDVKAVCLDCGAVAMHVQELANGEVVQKVRV